jgi:hypothetical protein
MKSSLEQPQHLVNPARGQQSVPEVCALGPPYIFESDNAIGQFVGRYAKDRKRGTRPKPNEQCEWYGRHNLMQGMRAWSCDDQIAPTYIGRCIALDHPKQQTYGAVR